MFYLNTKSLDIFDIDLRKRDDYSHRDMENNSRIVVDGLGRMKRNPEYRLKKEELVRAIRQKYAREISLASWPKRMIIYFRRWREIQREVDKLAPKGGCYLRVCADHPTSI